ncbi:MAG: OmpA family protein [Clostridia bacterium]|nr:OmpA family protein [Clostridia bacterium]
MKAKRLLPAVLMVLILAIVLTGISVINKKRNVGKGEQYQNPNVEVVKITLDEWIGWKSLLDANGGLRTTSDSINAKNGIIVEYIVENDAEKSSDMLISGDIKGAGYTINRFAFLQNKFDENGTSVIMPFITNYSNGGDGIISTYDIKSVEDLVGKKIAVPKYSEAQTLVEWLLSNSSLTDEQVKEIHRNMVFFETADETAQAFFAGEVDAAATWEPYLSQAASSMESRILFDTSMATNLIMDGVVFEKGFLDTHEEWVEKWVSGVLDARNLYQTNLSTIRQMESFKLMSDEEIIEMTSYASLATFADNMSILENTGKTVYKEMAEVWVVIGEKAYPEKAPEVFSADYISGIADKYPADDYTTFAFSASGRSAAENIANNSALLKVTLNIEFEADSAQIKSESYDDLREFAEVANILNGTYIQIEGNTAKVEGNDGVEFSKKRALSVAKFLNRLGVSSDRFIIVGNGDKKPIADNSTEEGRQQNRRTEVFFKVEGY